MCIRDRQALTAISSRSCLLGGCPKDDPTAETEQRLETDVEEASGPRRRTWRCCPAQGFGISGSRGPL
eukprot:7938504-Alexandrium_andersonii.AAC.1